MSAARMQGKYPPATNEERRMKNEEKYACVLRGLLTLG
jgi:hypothetical protein